MHARSGGAPLLHQRIKAIQYYSIKKAGVLYEKLRIHFPQFPNKLLEILP